MPVPRVTASCAPAAARVAPAPQPPLQAPFRSQDRRAAPPVVRDAALDQRLGEVAARFRGTAGVWVHDLRTGRVAGVNEELRFPAASTVKLAVLAAALRDDRRPERSPLFYDAEQIGAWSSNLGANRIVARLGLTAVGEGLRRLGMTSSSYPGLYRAGTATGPPGAHTRVTTARDLGRALFRLHAAALGRPWATAGDGADPAAGGRGPGDPAQVTARRRQRRASPALARRHPARAEARLDLGRPSHRCDRLPPRGPGDRRRRRLSAGSDARRGAAARPRRPARGRPGQVTVRYSARAGVAPVLVPAARAATLSSACFSSW